MPEEQLAQLVAPDAAAKVPAAQLKQASVTLGENLPLAQIKQSVDPESGWYFPTAQAVHEVDFFSALNLPALQFTHARSMPGENLPAAQLVQDAAPVLS